MAGIAAKTRGCATCRGRRIKCDLQKPSCNNCLRSGRTCQGYERHDVFVNRTAAGMQKRRRLEEVKDQRLEEIKNALVSGAFSQMMVAPAPSPDDHVHWFYRHFVVSRTDPRLTQFMTPVMQITTPGPLLTSSLRALSIMKFGRAISDTAAEQQGQNLYGRSLGKLRLALTDITASKSDETLACAVVLGLFELLNVHPKHQSGGWFKHMMGLGRLIEHRGPKQSQSPVCLAIFEVCRNVLMTRCLLDRNSSVFARAEWLSIPWEGRTKTRDEKICDFAFRAAHLIDQSDRVVPEPDVSVEGLDNLVHDFAVLFQDVEDMHHNCPCSNFEQPHGPRQLGGPVEPPMNTWSRVQCSLAMGVQLVCCNMTDKPYQMLLDRGDFEIVNQPTTSLMRGRQMRDNLACSITRLCKSCMQNRPTPGPLLRIMWALKLASAQLSSSPLERSSADCEDVLQKVIYEFPSSTARLQDQNPS